MVNLKVEHLWHEFFLSPHCTCPLLCWMQYPEVFCTSLGKWLFTTATKSSQFCFFIGFLLDTRYLFSNLSSKNEKVAFFQNLRVESLSFITISLSRVVVVFFVCLEKYLQKLGCLDTSPSSKASMESDFLKSGYLETHNPNLFFAIMQQCQTLLRKDMVHV